MVTRSAAIDDAAMPFVASGNDSIAEINASNGRVIPLKSLSLVWGSVTDASVEYLLRIPTLDFVDLSGCYRLSNAGVDRLVKSGLTVNRNYISK